MKTNLEHQKPETLFTINGSNLIFYLDKGKFIMGKIRPTPSFKSQFLERDNSFCKEKKGAPALPMRCASAPKHLTKGITLSDAQLSTPRGM